MQNTQADAKYLKVLDKKYTKVRHINEQYLQKTKRPWQKVLSIAFNVFCVLILFVMGVFCVNLFNAKAQNTPVSLFGYSALKVASGSMTASGFEVGDAVMVHAVDTNTLSAGDIIAFYAYNSVMYDITPVETSSQKPQYKYSFNLFLGIQTPQIKNAALSGTKLVFHQIIGVYQDVNGQRYFKTKGTSNSSEDVWLISSEHVLGVYVNSGIATFMSKVLSVGSSQTMFLVALIIPILILCVMIIRVCFHNIQIVKLELDCVEEKRKITDPICVKHKVGLRMDKKSKFKILATAPNDEKAQYANLLWSENQMPRYVRVYCLKHTAMLAPLQKLRDINRECEKMYKQGISLDAISKYYAKERAKIDDQIKLRYKRLMKLK